MTWTELRRWKKLRNEAATLTELEILMHTYGMVPKEKLNNEWWIY